MTFEVCEGFLLDVYKQPEHLFATEATEMLQSHK